MERVALDGHSIFFQRLGKQGSVKQMGDVCRRGRNSSDFADIRECVADVRCATDD